MARDVKWAIKEAEEKNEISKITVEDDIKKKLCSNAKAGSVKMFIASIIVLAVALAIAFAIVAFANIIIYSVKMVIFYILILIFPIYAVYNIISTAKAVKNGDYDFYSGEIVTKTTDGYQVKGLEDQKLNFLSVAKPKDELKAGDRVKLFRLNDELDLFDL